VDRRVERGQATRRQLVAAATELFAERGYDHTSIEAVLEHAGVSRGSLYHHFPGKQDLFEAVVAELETGVGQEVVAAATAHGETDPVDMLKSGFSSWIELAGDPVVRRILLTDAPAVLGWKRWREIEEQYALGLIKQAVGEIADAGRLQAELVDPFSHMLLATLSELAHLIAVADDVSRAQASAQTALEEFLGRLLPPATPPRRSPRGQ